MMFLWFLECRYCRYLLRISFALKRLIRQKSIALEDRATDLGRARESPQSGPLENRRLLVGAEIALTRDIKPVNQSGLSKISNRQPDDSLSLVKSNGFRVCSLDILCLGAI